MYTSCEFYIYRSKQKLQHPLDTRVMLGIHRVVGILVPSLALAVELLGEGVDLADAIRLFEELHGETFVRVPCDMAVHH